MMTVRQLVLHTFGPGGRRQVLCYEDAFTLNVGFHSFIRKMQWRTNVTFHFVFHNHTFRSIERGFTQTSITSSSEVWEWTIVRLWLVFVVSMLLTFCVILHVCPHITKKHLFLSLPSLWHSHRPLHLLGDHSVTELIIVNSILLLAALHVIWDVWGDFCSCHQGLLMVIARCRLPERKSRCFNLLADGIPRWPCWVPPSIPDPPQHVDCSMGLGLACGARRESRRAKMLGKYITLPVLRQNVV